MKNYYNIVPDLPYQVPPVLHPATKKPIGPGDLAPLFPMELIKQEVSTERLVEIPKEVRKAYTLYRPTPLVRAVRLEKKLGTPAKIYYKYEGVSPTGSHKLNTAIAQAYYNKKEGVKKITTETGAGQWGSALSFACNMFGIDCRVFMVKVSYEQKPYRKIMMKTFGAHVVSSPSTETKIGKRILAQDPDTTGSLGIAISEAVEIAAKNNDTKYSLGSVLNHVLMHQTIIGQEAKEQLKEKPDVVIGCVGGGSNFAGLAFPYIRDKLKGKKIEFLAVEPTACPSLTGGKYDYDHGDTGAMTPLLKMYTLGHKYIPPPIHAGGLRYHGMAPLLSLLFKHKIIDAIAYEQKDIFDAAVIFAQEEGIIPAPESAHAVKAAIDKAAECREQNQKKTILFNLSGHGHFDLAAYSDYFEGKL